MSSDRQVSLYLTPALPNITTAAASPNCPVSSYQGQNLNHWQRMRSTFVFCLSATVRLLASETKVKLTGHLEFSEGNSILTSKSPSPQMKSRAWIWREPYSPFISSHWGDRDIADKEHYRGWMAAQQELSMLQNPFIKNQVSFCTRL